MNDVVIVGAGVLGLATAAHLLERGARVTVVEADTPASATSGAGAGFVGLWAAGYAHFLTEQELAMQRYGLDFYGALDRDFDYRPNGNLYLATTEDGWRRWVEPIARHPFAPKGTRTLTPAMVADVTGGVVSQDGLLGGVLHPGGIQISAGRATRALAALVEERGGRILVRTRVTELLTSDGAVTGVRTQAGDLRAGTVILACGAWTNTLLAPLEAHLPLLRMVATRVISPPSGVPSGMPTIMVPDLYGLWLREHRGGLTYGNGDGYAPLFELGGTLGDSGQPRREELVHRLVGELAPKLAGLVPGHDTSIGWWLQGVPCMTPDRRFYAGPLVPGLQVLAGDNEAGVTHGPALGRLMADLALEGGSSWLDPAPYEPRRFDTAGLSTEESVLRAMPARR
ncbi:NAD(P)/FAD-dependent oxidoreductase [Nonomuraea sediminis]|uniref:NAD(P)/FAD-dependent oxidoreductase n=1 Tax=Nonomuraea sediminis TaxID=2835864 RepID=UPI001BDDA888|nr:FAD-dependent oxidoreductase [Nonomuraea sediminis]